MDTNEFLTASYAELAQLMSERQGAIPEPQPLDVSPWIAQSLLQKSIRRGETGHALRAAATLLRDDPDKLSRRISVASFEDIGLGSLGLIKPVLTATSGQAIRQKFGGHWLVVSAVVERMSAARKDRSADDLLMSVLAHPAYDADRLGSHKTNAELMRIVAGTGDIITRAIALTFACGTDRFPTPTLRRRVGNLRYALQTMLEKGFPFLLVELAQRGSVRMREPLPALVAMLSRDVPARSTGYLPTEKDDDIPPATMIGDVPGWSLDWYTRPGRTAIRAFLKHDTPTSRWLKSIVAPRDRAEVLGALTFRVEGGLMRRRLQWPTGNNLRRTMETEAVGFGVTDASQLLDLLRNDLPLLNEERRHVL